MSKDDQRAKREKNERLEKLGLRGDPDRRPVCVHCGLPFDYGAGLVTDAVSICDSCLD